MSDIIYRFFSPAPGRAVTRYGTGTLIGGSRSSAGGYSINPGAVAAIPANEIAKHAREYRHLLANGDLVERTESDHRAWLQSRNPKATGEVVETPKKPESVPADDSEDQ